MPDVCNAIRRWADSERITLSEALRRLGLVPSVFHNWERGGKPRLDTVRRVAEKMGVDASVFDIDSKPNLQPEVASGNPDTLGSPIPSLSLVAMPTTSWNKLKDMLGHFNARLVGKMNNLSYSGGAEFIEIEGAA